MQLDIEWIVFIFSLVCGFGSMIWKLAQFKEQIHDHLDRKIQTIEDKQNTVNHQFDITIRENQHQLEKDILVINGKIDKSLHKASRLENAISDINRYLEKTSEFKPRRGLDSED